MNASYALAQLPSVDTRLEERSGLSARGKHIADPFLFADRRAALNQVRGMLPPPTSVAFRLGEPALGSELVEEELQRIEREADDVARASVDLLPALLAGDGPDDVVAARVEALRAVLARRGFSVYERDELLEVIGAAGPRGDLTKVSLARLRAALEGGLPAPRPLLDRAAFAQELAFHVRGFLPADQIVGALERTAETLVRQITPALAVVSAEARRELEARASWMLASERPCRPRAPLVTAADLAPPAERARACSLVRELAEVHDEEAEIATLAAMHELVVTACVALSLHGQSSRCARVVPIGARAEAREERFAANHPGAAVTSALVISLVVRADPARAPARARRLTRFGDGPLHVLEIISAGG